MSYQDYTKDFKNKMFRNVILLTGKEDFLIHWALEQLITEYAGADFREQNVMDFPGENVRMDEAINMAKTPSMFGGERVIIVRNLPWLFRKTADDVIKGEGARLLEYAEAPKTGALLILVLDAANYGTLTAFGKKVLKKASGYEFDRLDRKALGQFIRKRVRTAKKYIDNRTLEYLIDVTGYYNRESIYTLNDLENDLRKMLLASDEENISPELVDDLLVGDEDRYVFDLIDALMTNNKGKAMSIVENILRTEDASFRILATLTSQYEMMVDAMELESKGVPTSHMPKQLGINEFRFRKAYSAARKMDTKKLRRSLIDLYDMDRRIKMGDLDRNVALELFVLSV